MSTYGGGLSKMEKSTKNFKHFTTEQGLANNVLNGLVFDGRKRLWTSTNKGISAFNLRSEKFTNYNKSDGIYFSEFMMNAYHRNVAGDLLFGTPSGLVAFNPDDLKDRDATTSIVFTSLEVNYEDVSHRLKNKTLHIYPNDKAINNSFCRITF